MQCLFKEYSTCESNATFVDDNCAMVPEPQTKSAQHLSLLNSSYSSLPGLSRWDSHPMRGITEAHPPLPIRRSDCPKRMNSFEDNFKSHSAKESKMRQVSPPRCPRRRTSLVASNVVPTKEEGLEHSSSSYHGICENLSTTPPSTTPNLKPRAENSSSLQRECTGYIAESNIQFDRLRRLNIGMLDNFLDTKILPLSPSTHEKENDATKKSRQHGRKNTVGHSRTPSPPKQSSLQIAHSNFASGNVC